MKYVLLIKMSEPDKWHILSCNKVDIVCTICELDILIFRHSRFLTKDNHDGPHDRQFKPKTATWSHFIYDSVDDLVADNFSLIL